MADLLQIIEMALQTGDSPIDWGSDYASQYVVPASNRRRILDREHRAGITPNADGWLVMSRDIGVLDGQTVTHWTRIRWEPCGADGSVHDLDSGGVL
ncbi:MAG: hypothetical protein QM662_08605 [Gordonia sp. (in: high G+C Gram-positive bacteria)]